MNLLRMFLVVLCLMLFTVQSRAQSILTDEFDYPAGNDLTSHGWSESTSGTDKVTVANGGLAFTGYPSSGIGNAALLDASGQWVEKTFAQQSSGDLYISFLISVAGAPTTTSNFPEPVVLSASSISARYCRFYVVNDGEDGLAFGLSQFTESASLTAFNYTLNTTYLIVMKYAFIAGDDNDEASLFVFSEPPVPATEPATAAVGPVSSNDTDPSGIGSGDLDQIVLRQASASNILTIDGLRVGLAWDPGAPLPVELTSFTYSVTGRDVLLQWSTATESNNYGFEVQRREDADDWQSAGFMPGHGTTVRSQHYQFSDKALRDGHYDYRLKQIDTDGSFEFSQNISVQVGGPRRFGLSQNYPNPFNPSTNINYTLEQAGFVKVTVFDILGKNVRTLVAQEQRPGAFSLFWDGRTDDGSLVSSGTYLYSLEVGSTVKYSKLMVLTK